jgi:hypothetical protein
MLKNNIRNTARTKQLPCRDRKGRPYTIFPYLFCHSHHAHQAAQLFYLHHLMQQLHLLLRLNPLEKKGGLFLVAIIFRFSNEPGKEVYFKINQAG